MFILSKTNKKHLWFINSPGELAYNFIFAGVVLAFVISILSFKLKLLTKSGAVAALVVGATIFSFGQLKWSIPLIVFFIFSNLLSRIGKKHKSGFDKVFEKSAQRDAEQVLANGVVGCMLIILNLFYNDNHIYLAYVASLAVVCADTWATEIGTMKQTATYNIRTFKVTKQGISGGVSLRGTAGAFLGAIIIAFSAVFWIHLNFIYYFCLIVFVGLFGCFFDSFLGATVQYQNKCKVCGEITERKFHCNEKADYFRGLKFITNDAVNFLSAVSGSLLIFFIKVITK